jgi:dolichol-phosphate hexosyltransferase
MKRLSISLILPTRNEAPGIAELIAAARPFADEIVVVDGHSTDGTAQIASATGVRVVLDGGRGKGDAYRVGIAAATRDIVVFMDADGSHEPADIPRLVAPIRDGDAECVIASRHKGGSDE